LLFSVLEDSVPDFFLPSWRRHFDLLRFEFCIYKMGKVTYFPG
jgi:hypothetical protein